MASPPKNADPQNVQGDILSGIPKKVEIYYFFRIHEQRLSDFRKHLAKLIPFITTATEVIEFREKIEENKRRGGGLLKFSGISIGFSHTGLELLGLKDKIDPAFDTGMLAQAESLNDAAKAGVTPIQPDWDDAFLNGVHGLIDIAGDSNETILEVQTKIEQIFGVGQQSATIQKVIRLVGNVRPGTEDGHEHFGFNDGISQPAIDIDANQVTPLPGQRHVRQGIILLGRDGDDPQGSARPSWTLDGSFLAFRFLPQLVPEFDTFLKQNPLPIPGLSPEQGSELLGARLVGRWKSGAPIDLTPTKDDTVLAADPQRNNNYQFAFPEDPQSQTRCPFAAHVRKTNPRDDLEALNIPTEKQRILRRGIQFGPEVTDQERELGKTLKERGLLFACYQSNINNGFNFIQRSWANNPTFPIRKPADQRPGFDPLIGQTPNPSPPTTGGPAPPKDPKERVMTGLNANTPTESTELPTWILSKGGEYFFAPSIPALKDTFAKTEGKDEL